MRVLIADDHALFRDFLSGLLKKGGIEVVAAAADGQQAVEESWRHKPDVVLMDLRMPGVDGLEATRCLAAELPAVKVMALARSERESDLFEAIRGGACGGLPKSSPASAFLPALAAAANGEPVLTAHLAGAILRALEAVEWRDDGGVYALNELERELLRLMASGVLGQARLAEFLAVTQTVVLLALRNVLDKLHLEHRARLVDSASRGGHREAPVVTSVA